MSERVPMFFLGCEDGYDKGEPISKQEENYHQCVALWPVRDVKSAHILWDVNFKGEMWHKLSVTLKDGTQVACSLEDASYFLETFCGEPGMALSKGIESEAEESA